jgi:hypothetical protein
MTVLIEVYRRVTIRRFLSESDGYLADIENLSEGPIPEAPELIRQAIEHFKDYAGAATSRCCAAGPCWRTCAIPAGSPTSSAPI